VVTFIQCSWLISACCPSQATLPCTDKETVAGRRQGGRKKRPQGRKEGGKDLIT